MKESLIIFQSKIETRWLSTLFVLAWTLVCLVLIGMMMYGLAITPRRTDDLVGVYLILVTGVFLSVNYIIWQLGGTEVLTLTDTSMEISNKGTFFNMFTRIDYNEIEHISMNTPDTTPHWIKSWGIGGGRITIKYLGRRRLFGQDLTEHAAQKLVADINTAFERRRAVLNSI
jgi:hypothetical protein